MQILSQAEALVASKTQPQISEQADKLEKSVSFVRIDGTDPHRKVSRIRFKGKDVGELVIGLGPIDSSETPISYLYLQDLDHNHTYTLQEMTSGISLTQNNVAYFASSLNPDKVEVGEIRNVYDLATVLHEFGHSFQKLPPNKIHAKLLSMLFVMQNRTAGIDPYKMSQEFQRKLLDKATTGVDMAGVDIGEIVQEPFTEEDLKYLYEQEENASIYALERVELMLKNLKVENVSAILGSVRAYFALRLAEYISYLREHVKGKTIEQLQEERLSQ